MFSAGASTPASRKRYGTSRIRIRAPAATRSRTKSAVCRIIAALVGSERCQQTLPPELR